MRVTMIGAGYVGLVSGACLADFGHHVTCIDKDARRIAALKRGEISIFEPGLDQTCTANNVRQGRLEFGRRTLGLWRTQRPFSLQSEHRRGGVTVTPT